MSNFLYGKFLSRFILELQQIGVFVILNGVMKLLLVEEDEEKVAHFISKGLEEEGYTIDVAYDGKRGLELLKSRHYDCYCLIS